MVMDALVLQLGIDLDSTGLLADLKEANDHSNIYGTHYQLVFQFPNGYGASVIRGYCSYGGSRGLFELAVLDSTGEITYKTPITGDVLGYLSGSEVVDLLQQIKVL